MCCFAPLVTNYRSSLTLAKKSDRLLFGCLYFEMITFLFLLHFLAFEPERSVRLRFIRLCLIRTANEPPVCFLTVFDIVFFSACLDIFLLTTSINSGTLCNRIFFATRFAAGKINFLAIGRAILPLPLAKAPKLLPLCL